jgi:D-apionolactonase
MSDALARLLYGTSEASPRLRRLGAGPLSVLLDGGQLRAIRFGDTEVIRGISFLVRDRAWGTLVPDLHGLRVDETADGFTIAYEARVQAGAQSLRYVARIYADANERLEYGCTAIADTLFETCRTGFIVLHPIGGVAGNRVRVEQVDGSVFDGCFPSLIDPVQPMLNLRALTHNRWRD